MSNTKKVKAKKVTSTKTKSSVLSKILNGAKYFLSSWFKNDTCVDARNKKWYWAVLIAVMSLIIAVIPTMSSQFSIKGGSFLDGTTYNYDSQVYAFTADMEAKGVKLKVENGTIKDEGGTWAANYGEGLPYMHTVTIDVAYMDESGDSSKVVIKQETYVDFAVYFYPSAVYSAKSGGGTTTLSECSKTILNGKNPVVGTETVGDNYNINCMFIGKESFECYKLPTMSSSGTMTATASRAFKFDGANQKGESSYYLTSLLGANKDETVSNWKSFMNNSYDSIRISTGWASTGITFGIYAALVVVLGFVIWIMTRGKNNPFRIYTFWQCQKISYWAAFAPAVLGMILGFFMSNMIMLGFILLSGVRVMWMSMRSLRPYQEGQK